MTERLALELRPPGGEALAIEWDDEALSALAGAGDPSPWRVEGEIEWSAVGSLRILSAAFESGSLLALAALRPAAARGHGEDKVEAALVRPGGEIVPLEVVLLSTEYGPDHLPRRIGVELYPSAEEVPQRAAGDADEVAIARFDGAIREVAMLDMRRDGKPGRGRNEILRAP